MPVVPSVVTSACGALLVPYLPPGQGRTTLFLGCCTHLRLSLTPPTTITTFICYRLVMHRPGPGMTAPTLWIVLDWVGQSLNAIMLLGGEATHALPPSIRGAARAVRASERAALRRRDAGFRTAVDRSSAGRVAARRHMPFGPTSWSSTFPLGRSSPARTRSRAALFPR